MVGSHKTSAIFGPSKTTLGKETCDAIHDLLELGGEENGEIHPFLFHGASGSSRPYSPASWCQLIKSGAVCSANMSRESVHNLQLPFITAVFKRHSGVALSPKDLRSSFITFLRSSHNNEALLKSCAVAMRHSNAMQEYFPNPESANLSCAYYPSLR